KSKNTDNKFDSRIDHYFNSKLRMFVRGSYEHALSVPFNGFGNIGTSIGNAPVTSDFPNITSNLVFTLSPTTILNVNLGFGQKDVTSFPFSTGTLPSSLGFPQSLDGVAALNNLEFRPAVARGCSPHGAIQPLKPLRSGRAFAAGRQSPGLSQSERRMGLPGQGSPAPSGHGSEQLGAALRLCLPDQSEDRLSGRL